MVAAAILENRKSQYLGCGLTDFDNIWHSDAVKTLLKRPTVQNLKFPYGGVLFHTAGTGFVRYYISLKFSRKTANIYVKKLSFYNNV